ncbi:MAG: hypothetical protein LBH20_07750 [Treponema sp.]|jgi:hypothetical protein|nr:hypothetical protein [Treponema sp.]
MEQKNTITVNEAIGSIPVNDQAIVLELHNKAINAGYMAFGNKSARKSDFYKMEYKKSRKDDPLFILHVNGIKWSIRCKLFHLDKYVTLLHKLSEKMLAGILSSRKCRGKAHGCTVGIMFTHVEKKYLLCRHGMHFRGITSGDVQAVWTLLSTESTYR